MRFLKKIGVLLLVAAVLTLVANPPAYETLVADAETRRLQAELGDQCPLSEAELRSASNEAIALCGRFGLRAYLDAVEQPEAAWRVYGILGETVEFREARTTFGRKVVAVIDSYYTEGSSVAQGKHIVGGMLGQLVDQAYNQWNSGTLAVPTVERPTALSPERLATHVLQAIVDEGETFLAQFDWQIGGVVTRKPLESAAQSTYSFLLGGARSFEQKWVQGAKLTPYDYGGVVLDVAVLYSGVKLLKGATALKGSAKAGVALSKTSKLAKVTSIAAKSGKVAIVGAKVGAGATLVSVTYLAVTDPWYLATSVASAGAWIAQRADWPTWFGEFVGWLAVVAATLFILWVITWPIRKTLWGARLLYRATWPLRKLLKQLAQKAQAVQ